MDEIQPLPLELTKALEKAEKRNDRAIKSAGYGASDAALRITQGALGTLTTYIKDHIHEVPKNQAANAAVWMIGQLPPEVLALCSLQTCLHSVAMGSKSTEMFVDVGVAVAAECWAAGLLKDNPKLAAKIEKAARSKHHNVQYRRQAARSIAKREGYTVKRWSRDRLVHAGAWLTDCLVTALPDVFKLEQLGIEEYILTILPDALAKAEEAVAEAILRRPVVLPRTKVPTAWTGWNMSSDDPRVAYNLTFMRTNYADVAAATKAAIAAGTMQPALDGVSTLQSVPWRLNRRIYDVLCECINRKIAVPGLPSHTDIPTPPKVKPWDQMTAQEQTLWKIDAHDGAAANRAARADRLMVFEDMETAAHMLEAERFYTPMNCDWRGRVYATCHFNFQREDRVRALFEFADGMPIGEDGLRWLKVHVANCGDFDKISKRPLQERIEWSDNNMKDIVLAAVHPMLHKDWWTQADKPLMFLAACMELASAVVAGPSFVTHLPVSFDGSCSGLQHLSAMTRDGDTAELVNLKPNSVPQDVYQTIADVVKDRVSAEIADEPLSQKFLDHGVDRKLCKRNTMTFSYSSKKFGMASQQQTDLMDTLRKDVLRGKLAEHPFDPSHKGGKDKPGRAARYIAGHIFDAIEARVRRPAHAMKFLQGLAKTLAHEGKPVCWTTPTGMPWINRYNDLVLMRIRLWMHDRGVKQSGQAVVAVGHKSTIDKERSANGVSPNLVHACDAAHLLLTVNAAKAEGITNIATVHDSFGCLAPQAARFNEIIREEFVKMYETHDVLAEMLARAKCDLTQHNWHRLPTVPEYGTLNLKEICNAQFAFA